MVAIRCHGLALDSIIGIAEVEASTRLSDDTSSAATPRDDTSAVLIVDPAHLLMLVSLANQRFDRNASRISRLQSLVEQLSQPPTGISGPNDVIREDAHERRARKRREGLRRQQLLQATDRCDSLNAMEPSDSIISLERLDVQHP